MLMNGGDLRFNISHTDGKAVFAFIREYEIGVDIEKILPDVNVWEIAEGFCAPGERRVLAELSGDRLAEVFFRCWTRKEAFTKALGMGLAIRLQDLDVGLDSDRASLRGCDSSACWTLYDLSIQAGYSATVVWGSSAGIDCHLPLSARTA